MRSRNFSNVEPDKFNWQIIKHVAPYLLEYKQRVLFALSFLIFAKIASVGLPFILKHIVDTLDMDTSSNTMIVIPIALIVAYGLTRLANVIFGEIRDTLFGRVTEHAIRRISLTVFKHLHALDLDFHLNRRTGGLSRDIERGTSGINFLMRFMVFNIFPTLIEIGLVITILWVQYDFNFAIITLVSIVCYIAFSFITTEWRTKYVRKMNKADSASNSKAIDSLLNYETTKYFTNESFEADRYDKDLAQWQQAKRQNRLSLFALNGGQAFIISGAMTAMMFLAAHNVQQGNMTLGDFVLINAFMMQIFMPLNFLGFVYREMKGSLANIEVMFSLLNVKPNVKDDDNAPDLHINGGNITFCGIDFAYKKERGILKNVDFMVPAGKKVAIVGESGAGKSTIAKLLFRFYDVNKGSIKIDGQDIRTHSLASLRQSIGIVPQETVLFNDSILENVRYGNLQATDEQVFEAIRLAHLEKFINAIPKGVHTQVGERGLKLSGGEKQRIAIARTILKQPAILVFDEATSSLDSQSEKAIMSAFAQISQHSTCLLIAHRLSTIVDADNIIVLDQGKIVEQGSHESLLKQCGYYAKLWQAQQHATRPN